MDQRERIERMVRDEYPGSTVVFDVKTSEGALREARRAERVAKHFGAGGSLAEVISFRIEDRSGRVIPKVVIYGPDEMSDEKLRQVLRMMG
jgi:nucleotide-binding universal stress UspA family protein